MFPAHPPDDILMNQPQMSQKTAITVAHGDGIGPEIMEASLHIIQSAGAALDIEKIEIGEKVYLSRQHCRHRAQRLGVAAAHQGVLQSAHHHPTRRRLQEPQRHHPQEARPLRQRPALRRLPPVRRHETSQNGRGHRPRERRGPLRRHRVPAQPRSDGMPQAHLPARLRKDRPLRLRIRQNQLPQEGHLLHEGQHHEDDRRPLPQGFRRNRRRIPGHRERSTGSSTSARPNSPIRPKPSTSS